MADKMYDIVFGVTDNGTGCAMMQKRSDFIGSMVASFGAAGIAGGACRTAAAEGDTAQTDSYGGVSALTGKATGFFHLDEIDGRHFLITPEGHGYRALGINHFHSMTSRDYDQVIRNIRQWGFNAGCYQGPQWMWDRYPYTKGINLLPVCQWLPDGKFRFKDVFDPGTLEEMESTVRKIVQPQRSNPMLIGYFWTDIPIWKRHRNGEDWISFYKALDEGSPGGRVWRDWKAEHPEEKESAFLAVIARRLYAKGNEYLRTYDKNHLVFGDRYHEIDMPDIVAREALPYIDAIAVQPTSREFNRDFFDHIFDKYGKPIYIADHVSSFATREHPVTMGQAAGDAASYVAYYERYVTAALSHPCIIGYNKCQYQDEISPGGMLKQGLLQKNETPYPTVEGIRTANLKALQSAYAGVRSGKN
jgi:hypothetical protein